MKIEICTVGPDLAKKLLAMNTHNRPAPDRALRRAESTPKPEKFKMPTKMSAAIRARMEKERFAYTPETLPWRAERMLGPVYVPTGMTYRGQRA